MMMMFFVCFVLFCLFVAAAAAAIWTEHLHKVAADDDCTEEEFIEALRRSGKDIAPGLE